MKTRKARMARKKVWHVRAKGTYDTKAREARHLAFSV